LPPPLLAQQRAAQPERERCGQRGLACCRDSGLCCSRSSRRWRFR